MHDFLYYNKGERNGMLLLSLLLLFLRIGTYFINDAHLSDNAMAKMDWSREVEAFEGSIAPSTIFQEQRTKTTQFSERDNQEKPLKPDFFNPNQATKKELEQMGLSNYVVRNIVNYRSKGGRFKTADDFAKIYGLSEKQFQTLQPFIQFPVSDSSNSLGQDTIKSLIFDFNPNFLSADSLRLLGLSPKAVKSIVNYRSKGGRFYSKSDFEKMYNLSAEKYQQLAPNIVLQPRFRADRKRQYKSYKSIDINKATSEDWQQFRGIGPSFARRIIQYQQALGGFVQVKQVGEVYMLPDSVFVQMQPFLRCENPEPFQININNASMETLKAHPYLRWFHAKAIIKYRNTKGAWTSVELLQILTEFDDGKATFSKIQPYLTTQ